MAWSGPLGPNVLYLATQVIGKVAVAVAEVTISAMVVEVVAPTAGIR